MRRADVVRQFGVVAVITEEGRPDRVKRQRFLPVRLDERVKTRRRRLRGVGERGPQESRHQSRCDQWAHSNLPASQQNRRYREVGENHAGILESAHFFPMHQAEEGEKRSRRRESGCFHEFTIDDIDGHRSQDDS